MKNILIFIFVFLVNFLEAQNFIEQPYYFIGPDEMHIYNQSNDTLYNYTSFSIQTPDKIDRPRNHFKIWENKMIGNDFYALKLERLDSIQLTSDPFPEDRFKVIIYKKVDNEVVLLNEKNRLTYAKMIDYNADTVSYKNNFGFTYYSLMRMQELGKLKKIKTVKDAEIIKQELNQVKYLEMIEDYKRNIQLPDTYASGLMATMINEACFQTGYSPIGANLLMNILMSDKTEIEKMKFVEEYYEKINPE